MTYIINPSWVYWLNVLNTVHIIAGIIAVLSGIGSAVLVFGLMLMYDDYVGTDTYTQLRRAAKIFFIIFIITVLGAIFIPSSETMLTMKMTELATKENIQYTSEQLKELIDYIIMAVKTING